MPDTESSSVDEAGATGSVASGASTAAEAEEFWRNRVSQKDKAHAAEVQRLQRELQEAKASGPVAQSEVERLQKELAAERTARTVETRKLQYPNVAQTLGDEELATLGAERLAALEERLTSGAAPSRPMVPNTPQRGEPGQPAEKTYEELMADLERSGPAYAEALAQRGIRVS